MPIGIASLSVNNQDCQVQLIASALFRGIPGRPLVPLQEILLEGGLLSGGHIGDRRSCGFGRHPESLSLGPTFLSPFAPSDKLAAN